MTEINPKRGELDIKLGDKSYIGRITIDNLMRIETTLGKGVVKVAQSMSEGDITIAELLAIIKPVIASGGSKIDDKELSQIIWNAGLTEGIRVASEILSTALLAGQQDNPEGNVEQAELTGT